MNLRKELIDVLKAGLPATYSVTGRAYPENPARTTVSLATTGLAQTPNAPAAAYTVTYSLIVLVPVDDADRADDRLEEALDNVLSLLWDEPSVIVNSAAARDLSNTLYAWEIELTKVITHS